MRLTADLLSIVKYINTSCSLVFSILNTIATTIEIVDVLVIFTYRKFIHFAATISRAISSFNIFCRNTVLCSSTSITLLYEEIRPLGIFIAQIGVGLEISIYA